MINNRYFCVQGKIVPRFVINSTGNERFEIIWKAAQWNYLSDSSGRIMPWTPTLFYSGVIKKFLSPTTWNKKLTAEYKMEYRCFPLLLYACRKLLYKRNPQKYIWEVYNIASLSHPLFRLISILLCLLVLIPKVALAVNFYDGARAQGNLFSHLFFRLYSRRDDR